MKKSASFFLAAALTLIFSLPASAHYLWLNIDQQKAETALLELAWGHKFPKDQAMPLEKLASITAYNPEGNKIELKEKRPGAYELDLKQKGYHIVLASYKPGFFTKTAKGFKMTSKDKVKKPMFCCRYDMRCKAIVCNTDGKGFDRLAKDPLEITPLKNIAGLKKGAVLPVKVWFKEKPLAKTKVKAFFVCSDQNTKKVTVETNNQGVAEIAILDQGRVYLAVDHKFPFPDQKKCDDLLFKYVLSFDLK